MSDDDYIDVFHASYDRTNPTRRLKYSLKQIRLPDHNRKMVERAKADEDEFSTYGNQYHQHTYSPEVLYTGPSDVIRQFLKDGNREYVHHFRIPRSAIDDFRWGDDHGYRDRLPKPNLVEKGHEHTLFSTVPLPNRHVVASGRVQTYFNDIEAPEDNPINYVIPIHAMNKLGIKYMGVYHRDKLRDAGHDVLVRHSPTLRNEINAHRERMDREGFPNSVGADRFISNRVFGTHVHQVGLNELSKRTNNRHRVVSPPVNTTDSAGEKRSALNSSQFTQLSLFGD